MGITKGTRSWQILKTSGHPGGDQSTLGHREMAERMSTEGFASEPAVFDSQAAEGLERWNLVHLLALRD